MKIKMLLKFYFTAEALNEQLDKLITYNACRAAEGCFEKITDLIEDKRALCNLMNYLESVFDKLTNEDRAVLESYARMRVGILSLRDELRREIKRAVMKFTRKLNYIGRHEEEICVLKKYRAVLIAPDICRN